MTNIKIVLPFKEKQQSFVYQANKELNIEFPERHKQLGKNKITLKKKKNSN